MDILLTNDDGIYADGLWCLYRGLVDHYGVGVVAPDRERSAVGHAITLNAPLRKRRVTLPDGRHGIAVSGTPADCVKMGILKVLEHTPQLVISGINPGANVGVNLNYSGTVAAAREAALFGVNAMSVSIDSRQPAHLNDATRFVKQLAVQIFNQGMAEGTFLNVNIPDLSLTQIAGVRFLRHGTHFNGEYLEKRVDPRNRSYYWQGCDMQTKGKGSQAAGSVYHHQEVDAIFLSQRYITITPVKCDTTDYDALNRMQRWDLNTTEDRKAHEAAIKIGK